MPDSTAIPTVEQVKQALAADGSVVTDEQAEALVQLMQSLGGAHLARAAVELLEDLKDAA
jgi:hypothetical protein